MQEAVTTAASVECVSDTAKVASVGQHILERRVEYLLGSLILYTTGILEQLYTQASGMC